MKFSDEQIEQMQHMVKQVVSEEVSAIESRLPSKIRQIMSEELFSIKKDIRKIKNDSAYVVDVLDRADIKLRSRVDVIEKHLHIGQA